MIANPELAVGAGEGTVGGEAVQSGTCSLLGEGSGHRRAGPEVDLVGRLAMEGAVRNDEIVFAYVPADEPAHSGDGVLCQNFADDNLVDLLLAAPRPSAQFPAALLCRP